MLLRCLLLFDIFVFHCSPLDWGSIGSCQACELICLFHGARFYMDYWHSRGVYSMHAMGWLYLQCLHKSIYLGSIFHEGINRLFSQWTYIFNIKTIVYIFVHIYSELECDTSLIVWILIDCVMRVYIEFHIGYLVEYWIHK